MKHQVLKTLISICAVVLFFSFTPATASANTCVDFFRSHYILFQPDYKNSRYNPNESLSFEAESAVQNSLLIYNRAEQRWEQTHAPSKIPDGVYNFIIDLNQNVRIGIEKLGIHHGNLSHGEAVLGFGKISFTKGIINYIVPHSGLFYQSAQKQVDLYYSDFNIFVLHQIGDILRKQDPFMEYDPVDWLLAAPLD